MALFGNVAGINGGAPSLFGNSLERSSNIPSGPEGNGNHTYNPTTSLFGPRNTAPAAGLGGSTLFNTAKTGQAPSLFGSTAAPEAVAAVQPAGNTMGGGLFSSVAPGGSVPLLSAAAQSQHSAAHTTRSAYFDQMIERGKKRNVMDSGRMGDIPSLHLGLADIARKARDLGTNAQPDNPRAHYFLPSSGLSTTRALQDLNSFAAQTAPALAASSVTSQNDQDLDVYISNLRSQSVLDMIEDGFQQSKRDFDTFLHDTVQLNWEAQRRKIYEHFGLSGSQDAAEQHPGPLDKSTRQTFGKSQKKNFRPSGGSGMGFGASGMHKSVLGSMIPTRSTLNPDTGENGGNGAAELSRPRLDDRNTRQRKETYASKVQELNKSRNQNMCYPLLHQFMRVEQSSGDQGVDYLVNSYKVLIELTGEQESIVDRNSTQALGWERKFKAPYLHPDPRSSTQVELRKKMARSAQSCLEALFREKLDATIAKDPKTANLGGLPSPVNKARAFIRILVQRKQLVGPDKHESEMESLQRLPNGSETDYVWALIYYLLRCGLVDEACTYVGDNSRAVRSFDRLFQTYMEDYAKSRDRVLSASQRQSIQTEYRARSKAADAAAQADPYKLACYKIIGRCDLGRKSLDRVPNDQDDWIWLQLVLTRELSRASESAYDSFGLEQLQAIVQDIGERHFGPGTDGVASFGILFFMQILAGMYEQAIKSLYEFNYVAAVHAAIALDYYGLLRVADLSTSNLCKFKRYDRQPDVSPLVLIHDTVSFTTRGEPRLQFALMVGYYTADFRIAQPELALDYLILLSLNADVEGEAGKQQAQLCLDTLRELVLDTREFAQLLGDIRSDGQRVPGAIQQRANLLLGSLSGDQIKDINHFTQRLTIQAGQAADQSGRSTDAVLLYHLAGEYENVLSICNKTLSAALTVQVGQQAMHLEPLLPRRATSGEALPANSSLSLTAVDDPAVLAQNMYDLYRGMDHQHSFQKIKTTTHESTKLLLRMARAKAQLLQKQFVDCIDTIGNLNLLPLEARGDVGQVQQAAQNFNSLPPVLARCIGDLLIWTVLACTKENERLMREGWETDNRRRAVEAQNAAITDLGVFAGLVRYKLKQDVFEALARAAEGSL